jgi:hypothetical protein
MRQLQRTTQGCVIAFATITALFGLSFWVFVIYPRQQHLEWYRGVEDHILMLADRRPEGMAPSQWAYCLHWTWNLHTNYGGYEDWAKSDRGRFLEEFDRRLRGRVDLGTIDWIWDEYVEHTSGGRWYSKDYRPTIPENIRKWFTEQKESYDLQWWLGRQSRLPGRRKAGPKAKLPL